jgi:hypothetical protein
MLWQQVSLHWVQWERLLVAANLPTPMDANHPLWRGMEAMAALLRGQRALDPGSSGDWKDLAQRSGKPLLLLLALAEELKPLQSSLRSLGHGGRTTPCL